MSLLHATLSRWADVWRRFRGRGTYPHELAFLLALPIRRLVQSPEAFAADLHLAPDARVLEVGPGPGYFSPSVARHVPRGRLVLVDVQREMLRKARRRVEREGHFNVGYVHASGAKIPFAAGSFDAAFLVAVLSEVPEPDACVAALHRVLCDGGVLSLTEVTRGDPDALSVAECRALAEAAGFRLSGLREGRMGFTAMFRKGLA